MYRFLWILYILFLLFAFASAQHHSHAVDDVATPFKSFKYSEVVSLADSILSQDSLLTLNELLEIYRMKALSHFSLGEELYAKNCFTEILEIDPRFKLDPVQNSPKIISFFNQIKLDYLQNKITTNETTPVEQINEPIKTNFTLYPQKSMKNAVIKSIVLPGWGHLYLGKKKSGILLMMGSAVTLPSMIYFIFDTNQKEKDYLNETNLDALQTKYDDYNQSYKIRNGLIAGYSLIWLYSQWNLFSSDGTNQQLMFQPGIIKNSNGQTVWIAQIKYKF
ncbi:MAG: hypothetical protein P8Y99_00390 [Calditrichaceae bacterium]